MSTTLRWSRRGPVVTAGVAAAALWFALPLRAADECVQESNLVANSVGYATHVDANLVNAWGVAFVPGGFAYVADNATGKCTTYDGAGVAQPTTITIPAAGGAGTGAPTGVVYNATPAFVEGSGPSAPATLIFASEDGVITAWNAAVDGTTARVVADKSAGGAVYKGVAIANNGAANFAYATDFHNGRIDVFDGTFASTTTPGGFVDATLPKGYAPFGIQNIGGALYVTYAKQDANRHDEVDGRALGVINVFDANGFRLRRFTSHGRLNAPWGIALAPADFGAFGNRLLVGNFGDGWINAFDMTTGRFVGSLRNSTGAPFASFGLWGIAFGNDANAQPHTSLFFAAGPYGESHGLYGKLDGTACPTKK